MVYPLRNSEVLAPSPCSYGVRKNSCGSAGSAFPWSETACWGSGEERDVPEHMMVEGFRWSIGPLAGKKIEKTSVRGWRSLGVVVVFGCFKMVFKGFVYKGV